MLNIALRNTILARMALVQLAILVAFATINTISCDHESKAYKVKVRPVVKMLHNEALISYSPPSLCPQSDVLCD